MGVRLSTGYGHSWVIVCHGGGEEAVTTEPTTCLDILPRRSVELGSHSLVSVEGVRRVASRPNQSFNRNPPADEVRMNRPEYTAGRCGGTSNI